MGNVRGWSALVVFGTVVSLSPVAAGPKAGAPKPPAKPSEYQVMTVIADAGSTHAFSVQSDGKGAYSTKTVNRTTQVRSVIDVFHTGTDWSLTTYSSTAKGAYTASDRTVFFDLREQVGAGSFPTPALGTDGSGLPVEYGQVTSHMIVKCSNANNLDMLTIPVGTTAVCPGSLRFRAPNGQWYRFSFQPENYLGVDPFNVTCSAADTTGCKVWSITPSGTAVTGNDPNPKGVNKLLHIDGGGTVLAVGGDYYLSFSITVAR